MQTFIAAYNYLAQKQVDDLNNLNLPLYPLLTGSLLDWVAQGLYGLIRPTLGLARARASGAGPYNTVEYGVLAYGEAQLTLGPAAVYKPVSDDEFQRIITWHVYKGDGFQYTTNWLKARVHRFLNGPAGYLETNDNTFDVSVTYPDPTTVIIEVPPSGIQQTFSLAVLDGVLALPAQYSYTIVTNIHVAIFPNVTVLPTANVFAAARATVPVVANVTANADYYRIAFARSTPTATVTVRPSSLLSARCTIAATATATALSNVRPSGRATINATATTVIRADIH